MYVLVRVSRESGVSGPDWFSSGRTRSEVQAARRYSWSCALKRSLVRLLQNIDISSEMVQGPSGEKQGPLKSSRRSKPRYQSPCLSAFEGHASIHTENVHSALRLSEEAAYVGGFSLASIARPFSISTRTTAGTHVGVVNAIIQVRSFTSPLHFRIWFPSTPIRLCYRKSPPVLDLEYRHHRHPSCPPPLPSSACSGSFPLASEGRQGCQDPTG
jgi:hypothetical protein